ncbi:MAG: KH domain-containing protein [Clostridiaceae bacterium]|nr:KH domain-containing protein [Clostridiaceae bacterium]
MTKTVEVSARSVEDAIQKGLLELGIEENEASIEVINEGDSGGLFGFGRKDAVVRISTEQDNEFEEEETTEDSDKEDVKLEQNKEKNNSSETVTLSVEEQEEVESQAVEFVAKVMQSLDIHGKMSSYFDEHSVLHLNVIGDDLGAAIGRRGETLDALEYLTILAVNKNRESYVRVSLDVGGYRERRIKSVTQQARRSAERVIQTDRKYTMKPMTSAERRQVHIALQDYSGVRTNSEGREPDRSVVIYPSND